MTIENNFKLWLTKSVRGLDKKFIDRHKGETPVHLRLRPGCGFNDVDEMIQTIDSLKLKYEFTDQYTRSPDYRGHGIDVEWNGHKIGMLLAIQKSGRIKRKSLGPTNLGFSGCSFSRPDDFVIGVQTALAGHQHYDFLVSMLDNINNDTPVLENLELERQDFSRVTSDFGEILAAYHSLCQGKHVTFPSKSNNPLVDYYEDSVPVSVKNPQGGGKVNLSLYKDFIDTSTEVGLLLYSLADHNKNDFFKYSAKVSPLIQELEELVGGTDLVDVEKFVKKTTYRDFYDLIKNKKEYKMFGIPVPGRPEQLWNQGDTNPFYFTLNTLVNRLWGQDPENGISEIVCNFLQKPKFAIVELKNNHVVINEVKFQTIKYWGTCYWSRATAAWHNWMGVSPLTEKK